jgi:glycosyltransferase involved in cell wall biosynthesis
LAKHILIVAQVFYPEQYRVNDLVAEWTERGYKVSVLTGIPNYPEGKFYKGYGFFKRRHEYYKGAEVYRIPIIPRGRNFFTLSLNYLSFAISGIIWSLFARLRADIVFVYAGSPITQALPGIVYAKRRKIPCFVYVLDLWPENVVAVTGVKNRVFVGVIKKLVSYIYKNCTKIFVPSRAFIESILENGGTKEKLVYWPQYAEDFYRPLSECSHGSYIPQDRFNIVYAGNIGYAQGLDILVEAAKNLKSIGVPVRFNMVGDGSYKEELIRKIQEEQVEDFFNFLGKQPAEKVPEMIACCDATLLVLRDNPIYDKYIPAKLQTYLACGKPVIVSANGEAANIVRDAQAGVVCPAGDVECLTQAILYLASTQKETLEKMGENALRYSKKHFDKNKLLDLMDEYIKDATAEVRK